MRFRVAAIVSLAITGCSEWGSGIPMEGLVDHANTRIGGPANRSLEALATNLAVVAVSASADDGNVPANVIDGNLATRWSAQGDGAWLQLDLGAEQPVGQVRIAWYRGNERTSTFDILAGNSPSALTRVYSGRSSGTTLALEAYDVTNISARYVRIVGHGNTVNTWNSITEVVMDSADSVPQPTPDAGAGGDNSGVLAVASVSASADDGNIPANAVDGSLQTRWSASGDGAWLQLDLGASRTVGSISIAWYRGNERTSGFDILLGSSPTSLQAIYSGRSSGRTLALEDYNITDTTARFVRIVGHGNSVNMWNSITEVVVHGADGIPVVTPDAGIPAVTPDAGTPTVIPDAGSQTSPPDAGGQSNPGGDGKGWSFFTFGDPKSGPEKFAVVVRSMYARDPNAVIAINGGDLTPTASASEWVAHHKALATGAPDPSVSADPMGIIRQSRFRTNANSFGPYIRYFGVIGNHDTENSSWLKNWNDYLPGQRNLPGSNSSSGVYYSFTHDNALFVVLDSQHYSAAQTAWLRDVLSTSTAQWKFVWFHHPVYPCNEKSPFSNGIEWVKLFEQYKVDIVYVAHSHTYERTCPMIGGKCAPGGVVYLNTSSAGASARAVSPTKTGTASAGGRTDSFKCSEILAKYVSSKLHFCHQQVDGCRLTINCHYDNYATTQSAPFDTHTIDRCQAP